MTITVAKQQILLVEDEVGIADTLVYALTTENMTVTWKGLASEAEYYLSSHPVDLVILDVGLPDANGFDVCKRIRQSGASYRDVPVLFLTARKEEVDRIVGLEIGGDDYVTKPFSPREVTARVKAILKRSTARPAADDGELTSAGPFMLDAIRKQISYCEVPLVLTRYEYLILSVLVTSPERVFSRAQLMDKVWDDPDKSYDRVIDTHIKSIRAKLNAVDTSRDPIVTHRGMGYSLVY